jgi:hypothetical protein
LKAENARLLSMIQQGNNNNEGVKGGIVDIET